MFTSLESDRLMLRRFRDTDVAALLAYRSDPVVARYLISPPFDEAAAASRIAEMRDREPGTPGLWFQVAVVERASDQLVGDVALRTDTTQPKTFEIGFTFSPTHHGRGYATEAARALLRYAFEALDAHRVYGICDARNTASARLMARLGMRREAAGGGVRRGLVDEGRVDELGRLRGPRPRADGHPCFVTHVSLIRAREGVFNRPRAGFPRTNSQSESSLTSGFTNYGKHVHASSDSRIGEHGRRGSQRSKRRFAEEWRPEGSRTSRVIPSRTCRRSPTRHRCPPLRTSAVTTSENLCVPQGARDFRPGDEDERNGPGQVSRSHPLPRGRNPSFSSSTSWIEETLSGDL